MEIARYTELVPFTTKDGSTIREYLHTDHQSLAEASLTPGQTTQRHYHRLSEEIYLILEGGGTMEVDEETVDVGPGDAILILGRVARAAGGCRRGAASVLLRPRVHA